MFQFLTPFVAVGLLIFLFLFLILFQLVRYSFRPSRLRERNEDEVYAQNMLSEFKGFAPWFPGPVNIAEVGYVHGGKWIPFFDTSKEWREDENNGRSKPEGYYPLAIGYTIDKTYWGVGFVTERGPTVVSGKIPPISASGPLSFTSSKQEGAILLYKDVMEIRDAAETLKYIRYIQKHCASWVQFIGRPDIRIFDLVLVTGWHKTSSWACVTFHDCSSAVHFEFRPGEGTYAQGEWSISTSSGAVAHAGPVLQTNERPRADETSMPQSRENDITSGSDAMVSISEAARRTHQEIFDGVEGPRDQGVFIRGYKICDRHTGLALLFHWGDCGSDEHGFDLIKPGSHKGGDNPGPGGANPGPGGNNPGPGGGSPGPGGGSPGPGGGSPGPGGGSPGPASDKDKTGPSRSRQDLPSGPPGNSSLSSSEGEDVARFGTGGLSDRNTGLSHLSTKDSKVGIDVDEDLDLYLQLKQCKTPTALEITLLYILENSDAEFALAHDDDVMVWLKDGPIPGNLSQEIRNIQPQIFVINQTGMLETTYLASLENHAGTEQVVVDRSSNLHVHLHSSRSSYVTKQPRDGAQTSGCASLRSCASFPQASFLRPTRTN
ncbi:hypothetical protein JB92DRAFT_2975718 [Gautieria morchelliformis]|nr:hypothetical protein JB92DRAFT_2975718 [Gautieria morchelliformis]